MSDSVDESSPTVIVSGHAPFSLLFFSTRGVHVHYVVSLSSENTTWLTPIRFRHLSAFLAEANALLAQNNLLTRFFIPARRGPLPSFSWTPVSRTNDTVHAIHRRLSEVDTLIDEVLAQVEILGLHHVEKAQQLEQLLLSLCPPPSTHSTSNAPAIQRGTLPPSNTSVMAPAEFPGSALSLLLPPGFKPPTSNEEDPSGNFGTISVFDVPFPSTQRGELPRIFVSYPRVVLAPYPDPERATVTLACKIGPAAATQHGAAAAAATFRAREAVALWRLVLSHDRVPTVEEVRSFFIAFRERSKSMLGYNLSDLPRFGLKRADSERIPTEDDATVETLPLSCSSHWSSDSAKNHNTTLSVTTEGGNGSETGRTSPVIPAEVTELDEADLVEALEQMNIHLQLVHH